MKPRRKGGQSPLRVLLAVGNPERERRLRDTLAAAGIAISARSLDVSSLADRASSFDFDLALIVDERPARHQGRPEVPDWADPPRLLLIVGLRLERALLRSQLR